MSVWDDIDRLKQAHEDDLAATRKALLEGYDKRTANSLKTEFGQWRCLHNSREYKAQSSAALLAQLPKPKQAGPKLS